MRLARYMGAGVVEIVDEEIPSCPPGGLLVRTEASGLCSGELMDWYMDQKIPHVLGHEVSGTVIESEDDRFPVGSRVFPHHHAPCLNCELCKKGLFVHCPQWKRTKLGPGGMAEIFAISSENLTDTFLVDTLFSKDAALIEPLACVVKSLSLAGLKAGREEKSSAVIGLGVMGLMHGLILPGSVGLDLNDDRVNHAKSIGIDALLVSDIADKSFDYIFVCPGSQSAFDLALKISNPGATIVMFAPLGPREELRVPQSAYFKDIRIVNSYSCGPEDTKAAKKILEDGLVSADQVVSNFISLEELPEFYLKMKRGEILKPMVLFP